MPNVPEMDVMWTVTENLLVDVNMSGKDVRSSAQAAQQQAESLIKRCSDAERPHYEEK